MGFRRFVVDLGGSLVHLDSPLWLTPLTRLLCELSLAHRKAALLLGKRLLLFGGARLMRVDGEATLRGRRCSNLDLGAAVERTYAEVGA